MKLQQKIHLEDNMSVVASIWKDDVIPNWEGTSVAVMLTYVILVEIVWRFYMTLFFICLFIFRMIMFS